eukprot:2835504-Rhodomonas_salina.3
MVLAAPSTPPAKTEEGPKRDPRPPLPPSLPPSPLPLRLPLPSLLDPLSLSPQPPFPALSFQLVCLLPRSLSPSFPQTRLFYFVQSTGQELVSVMFIIRKYLGRPMAWGSVQPEGSREQRLAGKT